MRLLLYHFLAHLQLSAEVVIELIHHIFPLLRKQSLLVAVVQRESGDEVSSLIFVEVVQVIAQVQLVRLILLPHGQKSFLIFAQLFHLLFAEQCL